MSPTEEILDLTKHLRWLRSAGKLTFSESYLEDDFATALNKIDKAAAHGPPSFSNNPKSGPFCWIKAKILEEGNHLNDGKATVVSITRIDDPAREVTIWAHTYDIYKPPTK